MLVCVWHDLPSAPRDENVLVMCCVTAFFFPFHNKPTQLSVTETDRGKGGKTNQHMAAGPLEEEEVAKSSRKGR